MIPDEDPNISWESHINTVCDPSNYEKVTKKRKCPVVGCKEILVFSNTIKCKDCTTDHCLKHRFGPDHKCDGPPKASTGIPFMGLLNSSSKKEVARPDRAPVQASSSMWSRFLDAASSARASAEAGIAKLSNDFNQALQVGQGSKSSTSTGGPGGQEVCLQCNMRFASVTALVEHVKKVHERSNNRHSVKKLSIDVCPKCSRGFKDPVALVDHVEKDHGGTSRA